MRSNRWGGAYRHVPGRAAHGLAVTLPTSACPPFTRPTVTVPHLHLPTRTRPRAGTPPPSHAPLSHTDPHTIVCGDHRRSM
ncbi:hypothetical protein GCM10027203_42570 [Nonomuraea fastidiosa]